MSVGDVLGHEPMGVVEEVGTERHRAVKAGDRVVVPFNISCGTCWMCSQGLQSPVRDHPGPRARHRRLAVRLHQALRRRCPAARPSTCGCRSATRCRSRCPTGRRTTGSSTSPTCCPPRGRRCSTPASRRAAALVVLGLGPIGDMCTRIAQHLGVGRCSASTSSRSGSARAREHGVAGDRPAPSTADVARRRARRDRRPRARTPSSTPSAWRRTARRSATLAQKATASCPTRSWRR